MAKKIKKYTVGIDSETYAISLVESPAIEEDFIALSKQDEKVEMQFSEDEKHLVYGAVLVPDKDIYRNNGEQEFYISFTKESIEKMSQEFLKEYRQREITLDHEDAASEVCVVESWLKADQFKDKSVALGLNDQLPVGTWFCAMKVNNIDTWERIKAGELKGFSVESFIQLEDFSKIDNKDMTETNDLEMFDKIKQIVREVLDSINPNKKEDIEPLEPEALEAQTPAEPVVETPKAEEPKNEVPATEEPKVEQPKSEEPAAEEPKPEANAAETPAVEEAPKAEDNHLGELIQTLRDEIKALKESNGSLQEKINEMGKQPSVQPINTNAKNVGGGDSYSQWREQLRGMIG